MAGQSLYVIRPPVAPSSLDTSIPLLRIYASLFRHLIMWFVGDTTEDHGAAVIWNMGVIMWTENEIVEGRLPIALANAGPLKPK